MGSRRRAWAAIYAGLVAFITGGGSDGSIRPLIVKPPRQAPQADGLAAPQNPLTHLALQGGLVRVRSRRIMAAAFLLIAAFLALAVLLDRWRAAVKATDEYEGVCWACGQTTEHHWGCPNR